MSPADVPSHCNHRDQLSAGPRPGTGQVSFVNLKLYSIIIVIVTIGRNLYCTYFLQQLVSASPALSLEPLNVRSLSEKLELEPVSGPKKKGLLSKLNRQAGQGCSEVRSLDSRISGESEGERRGAHTGFRNWGLAEELEPTAA